MARAGMTQRLVGWVLMILALAAVVLSCLRAEQQLAAVGFRAMDDWLTYALAVERWQAGEPIYAAAQLEGPYQLRDTLRVGFTYPPASVPLFAPFAGGAAGAAAWLTVNLGAFLLGLYAILRREIGAVTPLALGITLLGLAVFPPFGNAVVSGNLNLGIAALMAWAWAAMHPRGLAVAAGIGAALKIFPGLVSAWTARDGRWRELAVAAATGVTVVLMSIPFVGIGAWADFAVALQNAQPECSAQSLSIPCALGDSLGPRLARLVSIGVSLTLVVVVLRARSAFVAYAALGGALLAPVVDMHPHYWLIAWVVAYVGVVRSLARIGRRPRAAGAA